MGSVFSTADSIYANNLTVSELEKRHQGLLGYFEKREVVVDERNAGAVKTKGTGSTNDKRKRPRSGSVDKAGNAAGGSAKSTSLGRS